MASQHLHVAVDLDDVVLDFMGGVQRAVQKEYGVQVPAFDKWEISETLDPIIGKSWWLWMRERDWLWPNFEAMDGSIGALAQLRSDGHYVEIVTSKPQWAEFAVWKWLGKWRPPVQRVTIVDTEDETITKLDVTDADVLIDDHIVNLIPFDKDGRLGLLFDRPHNLGVNVTGGIIRVHGWPSVIDTVRQEAEGLL